MKKILFFCLALSLFVLTSCQTNKLDGSQQASSTTTENQATFTSTSTLTPGITVTPIATITPSPEWLGDILEFNGWLGNYYYAFYGNEASENPSSNSLELKYEIMMNPEKYFYTHIIKGEPYTFIVIDDAPIAYQDPLGIWHETNMKTMGNFVGLEIGSLMQPDAVPSRLFWKDEYHIGAVGELIAEISLPNQNTDWGWTNYQLKFARENDLDKTRFHAVLFPRDVPEWFDETSTMEDLDYLVEVVVNYAKENAIDELVVVAEATYCFNEEFCDPYFRNFGIEYIVRAFQLTREIYPEATLIYEDNENHIPESLATEKTMMITELLHEKGLIDYVGLEMHIDHTNWPDKDDLLELILQYPVPVIITSFSAKLDYLPTNQRNEAMNQITKVVFDTCLSSPNCSSISTWGESDKNSWENRSLLFDEYFNRKSAYYIAMQSMYLHLNSN